MTKRENIKRIIKQKQVDFPSDLETKVMLQFEKELPCDETVGVASYDQLMDLLSRSKTE